MKFFHDEEDDGPAEPVPGLPAHLPELLPGTAGGVGWIGVFTGAFLAFYAFIGFEDMVTLAEEVRNPRRNVPRAILAALVITTLLYISVAAIAVLAVEPAALARDAAPLALLVGERGAAFRPAVVWVGVLAGLNGALIQIMMASRIVHGMRADRGLLAWLGVVNARTRTPLRATLVVGCIVLVMALAFPLVVLAKWTSAALLVVFAAVNASLVVIGPREPHEGFRCPRWVPFIGCGLCLALLSVEVVRTLTG